MTHPLSSSTESEALRIGDPFGLNSRFHGNDGSGAGMTHPLSSSTESPLAILNRLPPCHPQPKAKRFGLGIHSDWIPVFTGMTGGTRITTDELSITTKNPTGQAPRYSLFCYLKWLHPCGKPQGIQLS